MPFVTRQTGQANIFKTDDEPVSWTDGDLWADSDSSPRRLFINNNGTPKEI